MVGYQPAVWEGLEMRMRVIQHVKTYCTTCFARSFVNWSTPGGGVRERLRASGINEDSSSPSAADFFFIRVRMISSSESEEMLKVMVSE